MNLRNAVGALLAVLTAFGVYTLWPQPKLTPEDEIRQMIARAVKAGEDRDPSGVTDVLDDTFRGPGGAAKQEVKQLLVGQFFGAKSVAVMNPTLDVTVTSPTEGHFKGTFVFARDGANLDASKYVIEGDVTKTGDGWKLKSASWNR